MRMSCRALKMNEKIGKICFTQLTRKNHSDLVIIFVHSQHFDDLQLIK